MAAITAPLTVYIPDTRGVVVSRYGKGNLKIGMGVYTYSRLPGLPTELAIGITDPQVEEALFAGSSAYTSQVQPRGTCPGATQDCLQYCYAARPVAEDGAVYQMWRGNAGSDVPPLPADATLLRLHVSGDFDTVEYICNWINELKLRSDVACWVYTKSWRIPELLPHLEALRALPNVQMFASMDKSMPDAPPAGWRRAWIDGDPRGGQTIGLRAHTLETIEAHNLTTEDGTPSYLCPEETKRRANCVECGYCIDGQRFDVTFLAH